MTTTTNNTGAKPEQLRARELSVDELDRISGGSPAPAKQSGGIFLRFDFKLVAVKTIS
jgi:hypothetical protein